MLFFVGVLLVFFWTVLLVLGGFRMLFYWFSIGFPFGFLLVLSVFLSASFGFLLVLRFSFHFFVGPFGFPFGFPVLSVFLSFFCWSFRFSFVVVRLKLRKTVGPEF